MYHIYFKRFLDFIISLVGFIVILPIFILLWLLLSIFNKGAGAFFRQPRPGRNEKIFNIIKFKTMTDERDNYGNLLPDAQRLTKVGKFIRKTSLDEIPQLLNVLIGDMSFVGPRPLLTKYLPYYTDTERLRHKVRPGITGLAQINGRNILKWDDRLAYDVEYVKNMSLVLDLKIVIKTIKNIFIAKDIVADPESIMLNLDEERKF